MKKIAFGLTLFCSIFHQSAATVLPDGAQPTVTGPPAAAAPTTTSPPPGNSNPTNATVVCDSTYEEIIGNKCVEKCPDQQIFVQTDTKCTYKQSYTMSKEFAQYSNQNACQSAITNHYDLKERFCYRHQGKWVISCHYSYDVDKSNYLKCNFNPLMLECQRYSLDRVAGENSCLRNTLGPLQQADEDDETDQGDETDVAPNQSNVEEDPNLSCPDYYDQGADGKCYQSCPSSQNWSETPTTCIIANQYQKTELKFFKNKEVCEFEAELEVNFDDGLTYPFSECAVERNRFMLPCEYGFRQDTNAEDKASKWHCLRDSGVTCEDFGLKSIQGKPNECQRKVKAKQTDYDSKRESKLNEKKCSFGYTLIGDKCKSVCSGQNWERTNTTCSRVASFKRPQMTVYSTKELCEAEMDNDEQCVSASNNRWKTSCPYGWKEGANEWTCVVDSSVTCEFMGLTTLNGDICKRQVAVASVSA